MTPPAPLPPYGYRGLPLPGGRRYFALGPGGPVTTWQQVAGARRAAQNAIEREREAGLEIGPAEERERITERLAAVGGSLNAEQYRRLESMVYRENRDASHPNWRIARTRDPNTVALWLELIPDEYTVWLVGYGPFHRLTDALSMDEKTSGYLTLGRPEHHLQYADEARAPDRLRDALDPNVLQQFWSIDEYILRWTPSYLPRRT